MPIEGLILSSIVRNGIAASAPCLWRGWSRCSELLVDARPLEQAITSQLGRRKRGTKTGWQFFCWSWPAYLLD